MAYLIRKDEPVVKGIRRVLDEQIRKAIQDLEKWHGEAHERIHFARQKSKRIRAALRLIRPDAEYVYEVENRFYRDLAERLSYVRDAEAMIEALDTLHESSPETFPDESYGLLRRSLEQRRQRIGLIEIDLEDRIAGVRSELEAARKRLRLLRLRGVSRKTLKKGLKWTKRRGAAAYRKALRTGQSEDFHEWRKHAKYLYNQHRLLAELMPRRVARRLLPLRELAETLGHGNDLATLDRMLREQPNDLGIDTHMQLLRRLIQQREAIVQERAKVLGEIIYAGASPEPGTVVEFPTRAAS